MIIIIVMQYLITSDNGCIRYDENLDILYYKAYIKPAIMRPIRRRLVNIRKFSGEMKNHLSKTLNIILCHCSLFSRYMKNIKPKISK